MRIWRLIRLNWLRITFRQRSELNWMAARHNALADKARAAALAQRVHSVSEWLSSSGRQSLKGRRQCYCGVDRFDQSLARIPCCCLIACPRKKPNQQRWINPGQLIGKLEVDHLSNKIELPMIFFCAFFHMRYDCIRECRV